MSPITITQPFLVEEVNEEGWRRCLSLNFFCFFGDPGKIEGYLDGYHFVYLFISM
uniref:Uncharacterized protein n=1 Tax=Nelumbo nucifera TaxID=4432 RepID=A0A822XD15_NELNU|nr:TPA_asm: hypothetical protein HUJ06_019673 [Nelumbo nucifera]